MVLVKQPNPQHFAAMYQSNVFKNDEGKYTTSDHFDLDFDFDSDSDLNSALDFPADCLKH